ncbi:hypothetical protein SNEBB_008820 [Seison nebaliae]|nr:hypothetical protein SNEBB_008820 [Seison nebaliae]
MEDEEVTGHDIVAEYATYEEFLDSQITPTDLFYLEDEELARQLVELGYRGSGEVLRREEFDARKAAIEALKQNKQAEKKVLCSANKKLTDPFLLALAQREGPNRTGKMTTIIFIRDKNARGQEISGYIDYANRLKTDDFEPIFLGKRRLLPKPTDLSFYNWESHLSTSIPTSNYQIICESSRGLLFKNKRDRKIINVDPRATNPGDNTTRFELTCPRYIQSVFYDHVTRRKT